MKKFKSFLQIMIITISISPCHAIPEPVYVPSPNDIVQPYAMLYNPVLDVLRPFDDYADMPSRIEFYRGRDRENWVLDYYKDIFYEFDTNMVRIVCNSFDSSGSLDDVAIIEKHYDNGKIVQLKQWSKSEEEEPKLFVNRSVNYNDSSGSTLLYDNGKVKSRYGWNYDGEGRLVRYYVERHRTRTDSWELSFDRYYTYEGLKVIQVEERTSGQIDILTYEDNFVYISEKHTDIRLVYDLEGNVIREDGVWKSDGQWDANRYDYEYDEKGRISNKIRSYYNFNEADQVVNHTHFNKVFYYEGVQ